MDITEFLTARLDEEESGARDAVTATEHRDAPEGEPTWRGSDSGVHTSEYAVPLLIGTYGSADERITLHVARHDPARVIAEIAAKRLMLGLIDPMRNLEGSWEQHYGGDWKSGGSDLLLRLLAAPYADHPDYDPAWRVEA